MKQEGSLLHHLGLGYYVYHTIPHTILLTILSIVVLSVFSHEVFVSLTFGLPAHIRYENLHA